MKRERKIYHPAFKTKAAQLSNERDNISELARELGIKVSLSTNGEKNTKKLERAAFLEKEILSSHQSKRRFTNLRKNSRMAN